MRAPTCDFPRYSQRQRRAFRSQRPLRLESLVRQSYVLRILRDTYGYVVYTTFYLEFG